MALLAVLLPTAAQASSLTVPDDVATIQAALDAAPDIVFVRAGDYPETARMTGAVMLVGIPGDADHPRPVLAGLILDPQVDVGIPIVIVNIDCIARVEVRGVYAPLPTVSFENCRLRAGFFEGLGEPMGGQRLFRRCRIEGTVLYSDGGSLVVDSCDVSGQIQGGQSDCQLTVTRSKFRGPGQGAAISSIGDIATATITRNVIEHYTAGILLETVQGMLVRDNLIADCRGGILVTDLDSDVTVVHNRLDHCGVRSLFAMRAESNNRLVVEDNVVLNSGDGGIWALVGLSGSIKRNLVSGSGAEGFFITGDYGLDRLDVSNNTSAFNRGSGFLSECSNAYGPYTFTGNIGFGNGAHGVRWGIPEVTTFRFKNWFDNALGDVQGLSPSAQDLTLDPLFCDAANGDLQLSAASPLADVAGYGRLGALGIGCAAPGVRENAFRLARVGPNPSAGAVTIEFDMPRAAAIEVEVFDILGRRVSSPARGNWPAGKHSVAWTPHSGQAGVYLVRYRFPGGEERRRLVRTP